ncbi:uncharacterized protein N7473_011377 [Penicillium subrubescens]|uniref:uncharacterized protein n=1 Tax=Penicillium subrubescens TaxID=1316194 RepID=UPI002545A9FE|nr:uncharacterized protein N7473_011377 [Penicillium subrubescens]KAJ5880324.1 hypothetical protein N7473_011377 [Penicillium subrubescens]
MFLYPDSLCKLPFRPSLHYNLPWLQQVRVRALSFVIANRQGRCVFLDLGLRENWSLPPPPPPPGVVAEIHNNEPGIRHELNACDILKLHDFRINNIEPHAPQSHEGTLSLSFDHRAGCWPRGRGLRGNDAQFCRTGELPDPDLRIFFGDGSLYLLPTPGHAVGHMAALVRVTSGPDSFVLLDDDACDYCGELRPSPSRPNPMSASSCLEQFLDINPSTGLQPLFHVMQDSNFAAHYHDLKRQSKLISACKNLAPSKAS